ncbi:hypothetical protein, partial [Streptomyces longwoodensis]|uniref:hypothetical protein n=1 Tax=Streptomyces longwoodensis TaxID=68231 RepID=UPI0033ED5314
MSDVTFQPSLYYDVVARDDNENCVNFEKQYHVNPCYSNGGLVTVQCGLCRQDMRRSWGRSASRGVGGMVDRRHQVQPAARLEPV